MKLAVKILSYTLGIMMIFGVLPTLSAGSLDIYEFFAFILLEAQVVLTLIYIHNK